MVEVIVVVVGVVAIEVLVTELEGGIDTANDEAGSPVDG